MRTIGLVILATATPQAWGHGVAGADQGFIAGNVGLAIAPYAYLGAKHMVTGYDHLLFLAGVIFFLRRPRDVATYVTLFALGHSLTLLVGVLAGIEANPHLIDAVIGLSVAYKAFENLGGFKVLGQATPCRQQTQGLSPAATAGLNANVIARSRDLAPHPALAVFVFGLFHGFGLATKLQETQIAPEGLVGNIIAFNVGVELGQITALGLLLTLLSLWRTGTRFTQQAALANGAILVAGFTFMLHQLASYWLA